MDDERDNIIVMEDDDGNPIEMMVLEMLDYDDRTYVLMQPADEAEEDAYIFEYEEDKDDAILTRLKTSSCWMNFSNFLWKRWIRTLMKKRNNGL